MTLDEIRKKNTERRQQMQAVNTILFIKLVEDQDIVVVKLIPPFDGFYRLVKTMQGDMKEKLHYRMHVIGDYNFIAQKHLSNPPINLSIDEIRALKPSDARIWTTPFSAIQGFQREIDKGHSILQVRRDGVPKSTKTTYNVLNAMQIDDEEWQSLLPSLSKEDLAKLQKEETWNEISEEELHRLENLGIKENGE
jgi:hypothetical protein